MGYGLSITFSPGEIDVANNRSYMTVYLTISASPGYYAEHTNAYGTLTVDGINYPFTNHYKVQGSSQVIYSVGVWIPHNADGSRILLASATFDTRVAGVLTASNSARLTTIPRASAPTTNKSIINFGESFDIFTNRKAAIFTHDVYAMVNNNPNTYTKIAEKITDSTSWQLPESWKQYFTESHIKLLIRVYTFNGNTNLGRIDAPLIAVRPSEDMLPECTISAVDLTENYNTYDGFVKAQSKIKVTLNNTLKFGAKLQSQSITADGITYNSGAQEIEALSSPVEIIGKIVDSRNSETIVSKNIDIINWYIPTIKSVKIERCKATGVEDGNGDYVKISYDVDIADVNNKNKKDLIITLKKEGESNGISRNIALPTYNAVGTVIMPCSSDYAWDIELKLKDSFSESQFFQNIGTGFTIIDFHNSGRGMAVGKVSEYENLFDVALPTEFRKSLSIKGMALTDYIISREDLVKDEIEWTVVKYASGDMHAFGNGKITFPSGNYTQWSAYWWRKVIYVNLPVTFYKLISAMAQGTINGRILETNDFPIMDNATRIEVHRYSTQNIATEETANAHFEIRGRWK